MSEEMKSRRHSLAYQEQSQKPLSVKELAGFLKKLSSFYRDPRFGNFSLSEALSDLATALVQYPDRTIGQGVAGFHHSRDLKAGNDAIEKSSLSLAEVRDILFDETRLKEELVILGFERFGISKSKLERLSKKEITEGIWAALHHEESLSIISEEAQRGGKGRSS